MWDVWVGQFWDETFVGRDGVAVHMLHVGDVSGCHLTQRHKAAITLLVHSFPHACQAEVICTPKSSSLIPLPPPHPPCPPPLFLSPPL